MFRGPMLGVGGIFSSNLGRFSSCRGGKRRKGEKKGEKGEKRQEKGRKMKEKQEKKIKRINRKKRE